MKEKIKVRIVVEKGENAGRYRVETLVNGKYEHLCDTRDLEVAEGIKEDVLRELSEKTD